MESWVALSDCVGGLLHTIAGTPEWQKDPSEAEIELAIQLQAAGVTGWEQGVTMGRYTVDFWFPLERLVVEVDGLAYHGDPMKERARDLSLIEAGAWRVAHFWAKEVFRDPESVIRDIALLREYARVVGVA